MPSFINAFGEVVNRGIKTLTSQTNIRQMAAGAKARSLIESHAKEVDNLGMVQDTNLKKAFLPTTFGQFLDHYAATVGLTRFSQSNAEALAGDRVFRFYVRGGGTFGSVNNGVGFVIPAGTTLVSPSSVAYEASTLYGNQEEPDNIFDRSIHYQTTEDIAVGINDTEAFASARAQTPGAGGNLAAPKMIKTHDFTQYDDYLGKSLLCENVKAVLNGVNEENAASFRYRISKQLTAIENANHTSLVSASMSVPGVADVIVVPWEDGAGRFNIYIKSISSVVSDKTVQDVQVALDSVAAMGCIGYARKPYEIGIEIDSTITFKSEVEEDVKEEIRSGISVAIIQYLNSQALGQPLILSELVNDVKQADTRIATLGFNKETFFDGVFVWYPARLAEGGRRRERLITNSLNVPVHARIMAENSISDPVRIV